MANALGNLIRVYTATIGTGNIVLGNPVSGFVSVAQEGSISDQDVVSYGLQVYNDNGTLNASEVGSATWDQATNTLTGRTPVTSTNSNNAVPLPGSSVAVPPQVFITALATDIGGAGTVLSVSAGNLSPLFTTNVSNPTTNPDIQFTLDNAGANTWFGNNTGGSAAPAFNNAGALTKTDDTNVTITLGGSPTAALLNSTSLTMGWTGTLAASRGGTGVSSLGTLTKADDTNVTLTLGGTPTGSLIQDVSITAGWTGTLSPTRGGTGVNNGSNTLTLAGNLATSGAFASTFTMTGATNVTFPTSGTLATTTQTAPSVTVGTTTVLSGTTTRVLYDNAGVLGEYTISGTGNVAMTTSPVFTTPNLGTPSALVLTNATGTPTSIGLANGTGLPVSTGISGLGTGVATMLASNTAPTLALAFVIDGGGSTITTGNKRGIYIPFACTITGWNIGLDQSGSIVIDIWKDTEANYPPTVADTITAAAKPTVTTATHAASTTLTGWTTTIGAGQWLFFNVDSVTSATWANITLTVTKT